MHPPPPDAFQTQTPWRSYEGEDHRGNIKRQPEGNGVMSQLSVRLRETDKDTDQNCTRPTCLWFSHLLVFSNESFCRVQIFQELYWLCWFLSVEWILILHKHSPSSDSILHTFVFLSEIGPILTQGHCGKTREKVNREERGYCKKPTTEGKEYWSKNQNIKWLIPAICDWTLYKI